MHIRNLHDQRLLNFINESNRIEGIYRPASTVEFDALVHFIQLETVTVGELERFVSIYQPGAVLRNKPGLDVQVGDYLPPPGGPDIVFSLNSLLDMLPSLSAWDAHINYEMIHPFTDGNGRSGRALWLWRHGGYAPLGFLHTFYYETLANTSAEDRDDQL